MMLQGWGSPTDQGHEYTTEDSARSVSLKHLADIVAMRVRADSSQVEAAEEDVEAEANPGAVLHTLEGVSRSRSREQRAVPVRAKPGGCAFVWSTSRAKPFCAVS